MSNLSLVEVCQKVYYVSDCFEVAGIYGVAEKLYEIGSRLETHSKAAYDLQVGALQKVEELNTDLVELSISLELIGNYIASGLLRQASMDLDLAIVSFPEDLKNLAKNSTEITSDILSSIMNTGNK